MVSRVMNVMLKNIKSHPHLNQNMGGFFGGGGVWEIGNSQMLSFQI